MIGDRIKQARMAAGFTLDFIVERLQDMGVKITKAAISNYENNKRVPKARFLIQLGKVLSVKSSYFLKEDQFSVAWKGYRKQKGLCVKKQGEIEAYAKSVIEKHLYIEDVLAYKTPNPLEGIPKISNEDEVEEAATKVRKKWKMGEAPIESVAHTFEANGIYTIENNFPETSGDRFDGLSGYIDRNRPVIIFNNSGSVDRLRFSLCHELGHLICENGLDEEKEEKLANRFAAAFLLPENALKNELGKKRSRISLEELSMIKSKYGISIQSIVYRLSDLAIITKLWCKNMYILFNKLEWRKVEPFPLSTEEKTTKLQQMTLRAFNEKLISREDALSIYPIKIDDDSETPFPFCPTELMKLNPSKREVLLNNISKQF